tara:strand:+ start:493 stop:894 length:402 start_codon:yes stop_codon:yes gene_type:complete
MKNPFTIHYGLRAAGTVHSINMDENRLSVSSQVSEYVIQENGTRFHVGLGEHRHTEQRWSVQASACGQVVDLVLGYNRRSMSAEGVDRITVRMTWDKIVALAAVLNAEIMDASVEPDPDLQVKAQKEDQEVLT